MIFVPYIVRTQDRTRLPAEIVPMLLSDALQTTADPKWQTDWTSEYISQAKLENYALKTLDGELVALGAYEISESAVVVRIAYLESHPASNPTLTVSKKYDGIGKVLIAFGIKLSIDHGFGGDVTFYAKTPELARHYEEDFGAIPLPRYISFDAPRYILCDDAAKRIFFDYLEEEVSHE